MNQSVEHEIIRRWHAGQSMRGIAGDLGISRHRVARTIRHHQQSRDSGATHPDLPKRRSRRKSKLDPFEDALAQLLVRYPNITATRMFEELRALGYQGGYTILRQRMNELRQRPAPQPVIRFETAPGVQAQMDWSVYDIDFTSEGRRRVRLFGYILSYSRRQYLCFTEHEDFENTTRQHIRAFEHLQGVAASCLYDNMKVVVQRWEDDQPIYNTRFLAFATHYGYSPWACRPRSPQTKGKIERQFDYVEKNLLNGRTFRSLEHLNEVTRWWLSHVADVRVHRTTKKRPLDAHAEELPHLLSLPAHHYDTARVIYRVADVEGFVSYRNNRYSVPWNGIGQLFPLRITEDQLLVYNRQIQLIARHRLLASSQSGQEQVDPSHRAPRNQQIQLDLLQKRFAEFGEHGSRFLEGLLGKQRCGKHQAQRVLVLCRSYSRDDVLAALERAVRFHAYSYASLERILSAWGTPRPPWQSCTEEQQKFFEDWDGVASVEPRPSSEYQHLLFDEESANDSEEDLHEPENGERGNVPEDAATQDDEPEDREPKGRQPDDGRPDHGQRRDGEPEADQDHA
jgi:transposase